MTSIVPPMGLGIYFVLISTLYSASCKPKNVAADQIAAIDAASPKSMSATLVGDEVTIHSGSGLFYNTCEFNGINNFRVKESKDGAWTRVLDTTGVTEMSVWFEDGKVEAPYLSTCDTGPSLKPIDGLKLKIPKTKLKYEGLKVIGEANLKEANRYRGLDDGDHKADEKIPSFVSAPVYGAKLKISVFRERGDAFDFEKDFSPEAPVTP